MAVYKMALTTDGILTEGCYWQHATALTTVSRIRSSMSDPTVWFAAYTVSGSPDETPYVVKGSLGSPPTVTTIYSLASKPLKSISLDEITSSKILVSGLQYSSTDTYCK